jgi:ATP-dependent Clp protease ATP-binding subunit ClpC
MVDGDVTGSRGETDHAVVRQGRAEAVSLGHSYVGAEHLLLSILQTPDAQVDEAFDEAGTKRQVVREALLAAISNVNCGAVTSAELPLTSRAKRVLSLAATESRASEGAVITPRHLLDAILTDGGHRRSSRAPPAWTAGSDQEPSPESDG